MADEDGTTVEDLIDLSKRAEQGDVAVAMRDIEEAVAENYPDQDAVDEAMEEVFLPFHETDRELAFTLGVTFGAYLQQEYPDQDADGDGEDE